MEREERRRADALDRYWDAVLRGDASARPSAVDDVAAAVISHLGDRQASSAFTAARERTRQRVIAQAKHLGETMNASQALTAPVARSAPEVMTRRREDNQASRAPAPLPYWAAAQFVTVLLLVLTLGLGYLALSPGRSDRGQPVMIPALVVSPTPAPDAAPTETLAAFAIPAGGLPEEVGGGQNHYVIPPGTQSSWDHTLLGPSCCYGPRLDYVLSGTFTMRSDGPLQRLRAGKPASIEEIPVGAEVTLEPGDAVLSRMEHNFDAANTGKAPVELIEGVVFAPSVSTDPIPPGWVYHEQDIMRVKRNVPPGPTTMRLQRVSIPGGGSEMKPVGAILQLAVTLDEKTTSLGKQSNDTLVNLNQEPATAYVLTLEPATAASPTAATPTTAQLDTLFSATLPAVQVPVAGNLDEVLWHASLDPGQSVAFSAAEVDCCSGPQISHVVEGELTVKVEGPLQLFRASQIATAVADATEVPPGTEVVLHPGDTAVYDFSHPAEYANHGSAPVHIIGGGFLAGSMIWTPAGLSLIDGDEEYSAPALPAGPATVTLVRATLPPRAKVPAPPGSRILQVGAAGDASIGKQADGGLKNIGPEPATIYVLTLTPVG